ADSAWVPAFAGMSGLGARIDEQVQLIEEVPPGRVHLFDQLDLPAALPFLDLPLAGEGAVAGVEALEPDQLAHAISGREAVEALLPVLGGAPPQVVGRASVERAVRAAGDDVGVEANPTAPRQLKLSLGPGLRRDERIISAHTILAFCS